MFAGCVSSGLSERHSVSSGNSCSCQAASRVPELTEMFRNELVKGRKQGTTCNAWLGPKLIRLMDQMAMQRSILWACERKQSVWYVSRCGSRSEL